MQVVYDSVKGKRLVLNITGDKPAESLVHEALREGIGAKNVLNGIMSALNARAIDVDFVN
ncbi:hypothetical protein OIU14_12970 [Thalassobacter stenotrophicus]|uniref:hypothetical protein n=1 Tax=Thalassobacter stenotrophicus TaxID=266809 RepID=UPI0022A96C55|nr:hypothetical protein [Thalassobacter stenotrophicus]UYP67381.1 hypothetical protein OIU14_12970 [Thalassobacter stenotrophicus]